MPRGVQLAFHDAETDTENPREDVGVVECGLNKSKTVGVCPSFCTLPIISYINFRAAAAHCRTALTSVTCNARAAARLLLNISSLAPPNCVLLQLFESI